MTTEAIFTWLVWVTYTALILVSDNNFARILPENTAICPTKTESVVLQSPGHGTGHWPELYNRQLNGCRLLLSVVHVTGIWPVVIIVAQWARPKHITKARPL